MCDLKCNKQVTILIIVTWEEKRLSLSDLFLLQPGTWTPVTLPYKPIKMIIPLTYLTYVNAALVTSALNRNAWISISFFTVFHFIFWYPIFGFANVKQLDYNMFYPTAVIFFSVIGWMLSTTLGMPNFFNPKRFSPSINDSIEPGGTLYFFKINFVWLLLVAGNIFVELAAFKNKWAAALVVWVACTVFFFLAYMLLRNDKIWKERSQNQRASFLFWLWMCITFNVALYCILSGAIPAFLKHNWAFYSVLISGLAYVVFYYVFYWCIFRTVDTSSNFDLEGTQLEDN